ncbi:MAG: acyl-homoserine-lactone synthase [Rhizomicrobium sp.]
MIEVVTCRNAPIYEDALRDMFRLRHRILVERRGLNRLRKRDGRQTDRFDTPDAIYLLLTEEGGLVRGVARFLPTTGPHVFADAAPDLCEVKGVQRGPRILELSRALVDEDGLGRAEMETARKTLLVGLFEFCVRAGCEKFTTLMPTDLLFRHLVMGVDVKPLGLTVVREGTKQVAVAVTVGQNALDAMRLALDVFEPLVHYVGAPTDDPLVLAPPRIPARPLEAAE